MPGRRLHAGRGRALAESKISLRRHEARAFRLVFRFVVALHELVEEAANPWRRAYDIARYDGMPLGKLDMVLAQAMSSGLIERHSHDPEMVTLTTAGATAVREKAAR